MRFQLKELRKHILALGIFLLLSVVYFAPMVFDGKVLQQADLASVKGMTNEIDRYYGNGQDTGEGVAAWTGSMFSGMPTYNIKIYGSPENYLKYAEFPIKKVGYFGPAILLAALVSFYLLLCIMGVNFWLAIAGAVAYAFASYNIIIIDVGHITKAYAIAYMPLTIAGLCLLFRQKLLTGGVLFTLGVAFSLGNNHIQITYYLALFCLILYIGYLCRRIAEKKYRELLRVTGILAAGVILAVVPMLGNLYLNLEMSRESLRGKTELTQKTTGETGKISSGLDLDYAFRWSYGKGETFTLMIPDFYGGGSVGNLGPDSHLYRELQSRGAQLGKEVQSYTYWGDQPFTAGPVYFGALVCFLFVLGMFVIRHPLKWWLLGATVFFLILSWGRNFAFINDFLFHYLPLYNKFRVPSMALVIPGLIFPWVGIWGLQQIFTGEVDRNRLKKGLYYAFGITGGLCLLFTLIPGIVGSFVSPMDSYQQLPDWYHRALIEDRSALLRADAFRSFCFILAAALLVNWFRVSKSSAKVVPYAAGGIALLMLVDLWGVDKRYLDKDHFISPRTENMYALSEADREILKDKDLSYRVLNLNDPFNESRTSYYHKSVGGYSPAKLRRYQELIDHRISGEMSLLINTLKKQPSADEVLTVFRMLPTLNMLNTRYVIYNPSQPPLANPFAYGNAWFVNDWRIVEDADAEIAALDTLQPLQTAVVDKRFAGELEGWKVVPDSTATLELVSYEPVKLVYKSKAGSDQLAIFSEIYYPHGWEAYIDGKPVPHFRADWILRALKVPAGEHTIEFKFVPHRYMTVAYIASTVSLILLVLLIAVLGWGLWRYFRKSGDKT